MKRKVAFEIKKLDNLIDRKICQNIKKEKVINISHVQARILRYLFVNKDKIIYQSDIEKEMDLRRSTISGILKTMEKNGLIKREDSKNDTRKKEVSLTDLSTQKHKEMKEKINKFEKEMLKGISLEEEKVFFRVIDKLLNNLR
ncbi:MAG: MarR family transcriptional regulator [Tenericutes bacterium]|nr:MarR family transcriptional regulator [Mycoplasmatota bacterium]